MKEQARWEPTITVAEGPARTFSLRQRRLREALQAYLFLLPAVALLVVFHIFPAFYSIYVSLFRWEIVQENFVGARNYLRLAKDADFLRSLLLTVVYVVGTVPVEMAIGLGLAILLYQGLRGRGFFRLLYFMPFITSQVAVALVWGWIFNRNFGLANGLLETLHLAPLRWLEESRGVFSASAPPSLALLAVMGVTVWFFLGYHTVIYLAGLTAIPAELVEAARIDGAAGWRLFQSITFPLLTPTTYFLLVVATIGALTSFNLIYVLSGGSVGFGCGGNPLGTTKVAALFIFDKFWCGTRLGYASAAVVVLAVVVVAITAINVRLAGRRVQYVD